MTLLNESDFHRIFHGSTVAEEECNGCFVCDSCKAEATKDASLDSEFERMDAIRREGL